VLKLAQLRAEGGGAKASYVPKQPGAVAVSPQPTVEQVAQVDWTAWNGPDVTCVRAPTGWEMSDWLVRRLSIAEKVTKSAGLAEEITKDVAELRQLFERKAHPVCYDGFEPSGRMHIAQGLQRAMNTNALTESGVKFVFWVKHGARIVGTRWVCGGVDAWGCLWALLPPACHHRGCT
jgi:hypothetical protein